MPKFYITKDKIWFDNKSEEFRYPIADIKSIYMKRRIRKNLLKTFFIMGIEEKGLINLHKILFGKKRV